MVNFENCLKYKKFKKLAKRQGKKKLINSFLFFFYQIFDFLRDFFMLFIAKTIFSLLF